MSVESRKILGPLNIVDLLVIFIIAAGLLGVFIYRHGSFSEAGQAIQRQYPIEIDVFLQEARVSAPGPIFVPGEKTFITIRNVPHAELEIIKSTKTQVKDEPCYPYGHNFLVTVKDNAVLTPDGPVVGGNKIKIGLPIILEGYNYKLGGVVSDLRIDKQ